MLLRTNHFRVVLSVFTAAVVLILCGLATPVGAQVVESVVGGVYVNADGTLRMATTQENATLEKMMGQLIAQIPEDLDQASSLRKISLKKLDAEMRACIEAQRDFTPAMCFLGGLTAIRYVVVLPEENDILLIGTGEGWKTDPLGNVVGKTTGAPVLLLQDLITVFRAWNTDRPAIITCSIDPTPEAMAKTERILATRARQGEERKRAYDLEQANGNHVVDIQGVPETSRFAKVLVAADYKLKQIGLGHEEAPVRGIPSYVSMINRSSKNASAMPRFWFAPEYETITFDSKRLIWDIGSLKVKTLTEDEYFDLRTGKPQPSGKTDLAAKRWCEKMNANFDKLAKADPVFAELKNCMDLAMVVALIHREAMMDQADCKLTAFTENLVLKLPVYPVPKYVPAKSVIQYNTSEYVIACGGVEINPFPVLNDAKLDARLDNLEAPLATPMEDRWYENPSIPPRLLPSRQPTR